MGKTYAWHLIRKVALGHGITPVLLDLSQLQNIEEACGAIVDAMELNEDEMRARVLIDKATEERLGLKFGRWLACSTRARRPAKWWLVLDHLDRTSQKLREDFVQPLINGLRGNPKFTQAVLILIGEEVAADPLLTVYTLDDYLEGLMRSDVETFAIRYAASIGRTLRPEELAAVVRQIANDWTGPFTPAQMAAVAREAKRVMESVIV
jgi:hypothetical protein